MKTVIPDRNGDIENYTFEKGKPARLPDHLADALISRGYAVDISSPPPFAPTIPRKRGK